MNSKGTFPVKKANGEASPKTTGFLSMPSYEFCALGLPGATCQPIAATGKTLTGDLSVGAMTDAGNPSWQH